MPRSKSYDKLASESTIEEGSESNAPVQDDPYSSSNFLSKLTYSFLNPMLRLGSKRPLEIEDVIKLPKSLYAEHVEDRFQTEWDKEKFKEKPSLPKAVIRSLGKTFWVIGVVKMFSDVFQFGGAVMLGFIVNFVSANREKNEVLKEDIMLTLRGLIYVLLLFFVMLSHTFCVCAYWFVCGQLGTRARTGVGNAVYRKSFVLSNKARQQTTVGSIVNLQSIDCQKFVEVIPSLHILWSAPLQMILSVTLLYRQLGISALSGIIIMVLLVPLNGRMSDALSKLGKEIMKLRDVRTKNMNEILTGIRIIKYFAWEHKFMSRIEEARQKEIEFMRRCLTMRVIVVFVWATSPIFVSTTTFAVYTLLGNHLTPEKAFSALAIFNILRQPLGAFPGVISSIIEAKVSVARLTKYLQEDEIDLNAVVIGTDPRARNAIEIVNGTFSWKEEGPPTLDNINIKIPKGLLVAVVGPVGCGKTSLLTSMLGEIPKSNGTVTVNGTRAYVSQQAWIQNASLRDNILFGLPYQKHKYNRIVSICELETDFKILPHGDKTEIGEKGINLSGGQRQRIAIARALYQEKDIYILDDCLSALDAHVGKNIFENCISDGLREKTRILATHQLQYVNRADLVIVLDQGKVTEFGSYQQLMDAKKGFYTLITTHVKPEVEDDETLNTRERALTIRPADQTKPRKEIIVQEAREVGAVKVSVWKPYIKAMGSIILPIVVFLSFIFESGTKVVNDIWLSRWSDDPKGEKHSSMFYLEVYSIIAFTTLLMVLSRAYLFGRAGINSAKAMHLYALERVMRAPVSFFDTTPVGRILNIFSKDINSLDEGLPRSLSMFAVSIFTCISTLLVICFVTPLFLFVVVPLSFLYRRIQKYFLQSTRELKRLESITKSPIFAQFSETLAGVSTIRSFDKKDAFIRYNNEKVDTNNQAWFANTAANRWLNLRLDFVGIIVVSISATFCVVQRYNMEPGLVGLAIAYGLQLTSVLGLLVRNSTDAENQMVAVERIWSYTTVPQEAPSIIEDSRPPRDWPTKGEIQLNDIKMRYREGLDLVLKGLTVKIESHSKTGIVGRTGAGKSSLMHAMFRMVELTEGCIVIDGIDISTIGLDDLRKKLSIIPQGATLFTGTVRSNLDPFNEHSDMELWQAIDSVSLKTYVEGLPEKLETPVIEGGLNFSVGQRQLLCLARAIVLRSKVLIMDEATAAVDLETDALIQKTIRKEFANTTVLTIAHRINTILDYDKILVLERGRIAEYDSPKNLLKDTESIFYAMTYKSGTLEDIEEFYKGKGVSQ